MKRHNELNEFYNILNKMVIIACKKNLRLVIENPYMQPHYLTTYWCIKPGIIDLDRTENGDYYKKPTQYFFINFKPQNNLVWECLEYVETKRVAKLKNHNDISVKTQRSMIHPQYASRFIRQYLIEEEQ